MRGNLTFEFPWPWHYVIYRTTTWPWICNVRVGTLYTRILI